MYGAWKFSVRHSAGTLGLMRVRYTSGGVRVVEQPLKLSDGNMLLHDFAGDCPC